jgi:hypothetical protein
MTRPPRKKMLDIADPFEELAALAEAKLASKATK